MTTQPAPAPTASTGSPGVARASAWWHGKYGRRLLIEIAICGGLLTLYRTIRVFNKGDLVAAFDNAREVVRFESMLGLPFESAINNWLIEHEWAVTSLNWYYILAHFPAAIGLLLWLYLRHPERYPFVRNLMAFVTFAALVIHFVYPLAPPRMMAGFTDTMREFGPNIYPANALEGAANQIAAMPSLHFGWAMIEAIAIVMVLSSRWRFLAVLHPTLMALAVIGTANHWWLDAAAAGLLITGAIAFWRIVTAWIGDRRWSWTKFRFETRAGIDRLEQYANGAPSSVSKVAND